MTLEDLERQWRKTHEQYVMCVELPDKMDLDKYRDGLRAISLEEFITTTESTLPIYRRLLHRRLLHRGIYDEYRDEYRDILMILEKALARAQILKIARDRGLEAAMLWKLSR